MVPPKNGFLSLRFPIFGSSYYQCFYTFGIAPCSVGIFGIGIPHIGRSRGSYFQLSRQKPDQNQFIVWKKHTGDLKSEHSIEENYFDPATVQIQSIGMQKWWESGHTYIHSLELGLLGLTSPQPSRLPSGNLESWGKSLGCEGPNTSLLSAVRYFSIDTVWTKAVVGPMWPKGPF